MTYRHLRRRMLGLGLGLICTAAIVNAQQAEEKFNRGAVIDKVASAADPSKSYALYALREALKAQREAAKASEPSPSGTVARRVIESLFIEFVERGNTALAQKEYDKAVAYYSVCTEIQPDN